MATFEARKVLMKDAQGRYVIPFTGAVETVNGQKPDENGNVVIEGVDTTTLLTKTAAAETYLGKTDAASTYLNVDTAADTFLSKTDAASTYLKAGTAADTFLSKADASSTYLTPSQANATYLGIGDKAVSAETADNAVSATMASKAISDINGNAIATTYATNQSLFSNSGVGPLLRSDVMPIKTVNGQEPDASGNIQVGTGDAYEADILEAADKALETVTNIGGTDIADVLSAVATVETGLASKINTSTPHIVETWKSSDGLSWYRKWSDGWIEQGGYETSYDSKGTYTCSKTIVFNTPFSDTKYGFHATTRGESQMTYEDKNTARSTTGLKVSNNIKNGISSNTTQGISWYACGY